MARQFSSRVNPTIRARRLLRARLYSPATPALRPLWGRACTYHLNLNPRCNSYCPRAHSPPNGTSFEGAVSVRSVAGSAKPPSSIKSAASVKSSTSTANLSDVLSSIAGASQHAPLYAALARRVVCRQCGSWAVASDELDSTLSTQTRPTLAC